MHLMTKTIYDTSTFWNKKQQSKVTDDYFGLATHVLHSYVKQCPLNKNFHKIMTL